MFYEIHIAANSITDSAKEEVLARGFKANHFIRHNEVSESAWRATSKTQNPQSDDEWQELVRMLLSNGFTGTIIEEKFDPSSVTTMKGVLDVGPSETLPWLTATQVPPGEQKACDIHITVDLKKTTLDALASIEAFCRASVDREPEGTKRIFTLTCESLADGHAIRDQIAKFLCDLPGFTGQVYLEEIIRYVRHPEDAPVLSRVSTQSAKEWLSKVSDSRRSAPQGAPTPLLDPAG